jgi:hypothetical protein
LGTCEVRPLWSVDWVHGKAYTPSSTSVSDGG